MPIPFHKPCLGEAESRYVLEVLASDKLSGDGVHSRISEALLRERLDGHRVMLTASGTDALELAALLSDIGPGDDVIMPSFTFSSTANAFCLRGARPVFVDISSDTLNLDPALLDSAIGPATRAIVPVHYAGVACDMDAINAVAARHGLLVIEDAAHAIFARYKGRSLGTIGDLGCFSFHDTKTLVSGEGGALAVNRPELVARAEILREKGTNRSAFLRGEIDKYTWVDVGSSYLPGELAAAVLRGQLEAADEVFALRRRRFTQYCEAFAPLAERGLLQLPVIPTWSETTYHLFHVLTDTERARDGLLAYLRERHIGAAFHYVPLHDSPMGRRIGHTPAPLPCTESAAARLLRLPLYNTLDADACDSVINAVFDFFRVRRAG
ncbi:MAG: dTDP-4-amino-4,6-dideoxygalactose transaminase [Gammaproteobacteria bacterium]